MKNEKIKFREVAETISSDFLSNDYSVGMNVESEAALMERFGISRKTVRNALEVLESEGIISSSQGKRRTLICKPLDKNKVRRSLNFGLIGNINILDSEKTDYPTVAHGITEVLSRHDATLTLFPHIEGYNPNVLEYIQQVYAKNLVDGFFIAKTYDETEVYDFLQMHKIPFVRICSLETTRQYFKKMTELPSILVKESEPITNYFKKLRERGIRNFHLMGSVEDFTPNRSDDLFRHAATANKVHYESCLMEHPTYTMLHNWIATRNREDSCLIFSNALVIQADMILTDLKNQSRQKSEVVLFRHYAPNWSFYQGKYTIISRPILEIGRAAAELILQLTLKPEEATTANIIFDACIQEKNNILHTLEV